MFARTLIQISPDPRQTRMSRQALPAVSMLRNMSTGAVLMSTTRRRTHPRRAGNAAGLRPGCASEGTRQMDASAKNAPCWETTKASCRTRQRDSGTNYAELNESSNLMRSPRRKEGRISATCFMATGQPFGLHGSRPLTISTPHKSAGRPPWKGGSRAKSPAGQPDQRSHAWWSPLRHRPNATNQNGLSNHARHWPRRMG